MLKNTSLHLVGILCLFFTSLQAQVELIKDIVPGRTGSEVSIVGQTNSKVYFTAITPAEGLELWTTDGTTAGTFLLKDINPGTANAFNGSRLFSGIAVGNLFYFAADNGTTGYELWRTDGTTAGTFLLKDIYDGFLESISYSYNSFHVMGDKLLFPATDAGTANELWITDGTTAGTQRVKDINGGIPSAYPRHFASANGYTFFRANDLFSSFPTNYELWKTDGTSEGTTKVKEINPSGNADVRQLKVLNNQVYFLAEDGTGGIKLWKSDGTENGTVAVSTVFGNNYESPYMVSTTNKLYYGLNFGALYMSNGNSEFMPVPNSDQFNFNYIQEVIGDEVYFYADGTNGITGLWKTDGINTIQLNATSSQTYTQYDQFLQIGSTLYTSYNDIELGDELAISDGSPNSLMVNDIVTGSQSSLPAAFIECDSKLHFAAGNENILANDNIHAWQLWESNGTSNGTFQLSNVWLASYEFFNPNFQLLGFDFPRFEIYKLGNELIFSGYDPLHGFELWKYSPNSELTVTLFNNGSLGCYNDDTGEISAIVSGGVGDYSFAWSDAQLDQYGWNPKNVSPGVYSLTVTDNNGLTATESITVDSPQAPTITINTTEATPENSDGTASVTVVGTATPYSFAWSTDPIQTDDTAIDLAAGTYTVTITDANGCTSVETAVVEEEEIILTPCEDIQFSDEFEGSDLNTNWSFNSPPFANYTATLTGSGQLDIDGDPFQEPPFSESIPSLVQVLDPNDENWTVETKVDLNTENNGLTKAGGICMGQLFDGSIFTSEIMSIKWEEYNSSFYINVLQNSFPVINEDVAYLRVERNGNILTFSYKTASTDWQILATEVDSYLLDLDRIGLFGYSNYLNVLTSDINLRQAGPNSIYFDYFRFEECEDGCQPSTSDNLIVNPSAELPPMENGWTSPNGINWQQRSTDPTPLDGTAYFFAGDNDFASLQQDIDVSIYSTDIDASLATFSYSAFVRSFGQNPPDLAQTNLFYLDANGTVIEQFNSLEYGDGSNWVEVQDTRIAPVGTRTIRVELNSTRNSGGNNDGYFDNLSLTATVNCETVDCSIFSIETIAQDISCSTAADGLATVTTTGGTPPYTYQWDDANMQTTSIIDNLTAGIYSVTVTDANNCTAEGITIITEPEPLAISATITPETVDCNGSISIAVTGGTESYSYFWSNGTTSPDLTNLCAGDYGLTVTDENDCSINTIITVEDATVECPSVLNTTINSISDMDVTISWDEVFESVGYYFRYRVLGTDNWIEFPLSTPTVGLSNLLENTTYEYEIQTVCVDGASWSMTFTFTTNPAPVACPYPTNIQATVVSGNAIKLTWDAVPDFTKYRVRIRIQGSNEPWVELNALINYRVITGLMPNTTYEYRVKTNCTNENSIWSPTMTITTGTSLCDNATNIMVSDILHNTATVSWTATANDVKYKLKYKPAGGAWTTLTLFNTSITLTDLLPETVYYFKLKTKCSADWLPWSTRYDFMTLPEVITPTLEVAIQSFISPLCYADANGSIQLSTTGGTPPYTYEWDNMMASGSNPTGLTAGTYVATVTDANNETTSITVVLNEPTELLATINQDFPAGCNGEGGTASVLADGGTEPYLYTWDDMTIGQTASNLSVGTHTVTITDANQCTTTLSVEITSSTELDILVTQDQNADCNGMGAVASVQVLNGSTSNTYIWSNNQTGPTASNLSAGLHTVTVTDAGGCSTEGSIFITTDIIVAVQKIKDVTCSGQQNGQASASITSGQTPFSFEWDNGENNSYGATLDGGIHTITITDQDGCIGVGMVEILEPDPITFQVSQDVSNQCAGSGIGETISLTTTGGNPPYQYDLGLGSGLSSDNTFSELAAGGYNITVVDSEWCGLVAPIFVQNTEGAAPIAAFDYSTSGLSVVAIDLSSNDPTSWQWSFGGDVSSISDIADYTFASAGTFEVCLTVTNDCGSDMICQMVTVNNIDARIENGITPYTKQSAFDQISVYPNPTNGVLYLDYNLSTESNVSITIFDQLGRKQKSISNGQNQHKGFNQQTIVLDDLQDGIYWISVHTDTDNWTTKIIKTN